MASSRSTNGLSQQMEKMTVNGKRHADTPRYTPPHRKYAQANKSVETSTAGPAKDANNTPAIARTTSEKPVKPETIAATESKVTKETKTTPAAAPSKESDTEPKPKTTTRAMAPHRKYSKPTTEVADSWEEEASTDREPSSTSATTHIANPTSEPAPVPKSSYVPPHLKYRSAAPSPPSHSVTPPSRSGTPSSSASSERRPEKTNAVAHRLIAGALGVKVPRRTEEQRAYDKAMREQEKRKRDKEREAKKKAEEDAAKAKAAIWDD
ncbi:unnamed protein product [Aureobasidium mustum]|uniref:Uncharacterized protein n=1 Tax=Aureobasidium mustum TaxID=2773714 RepID=A0A9N8PJ04_9PEZI|nr:unnamed protein product [Aureobasidium mustum]